MNNLRKSAVAVMIVVYLSGISAAKAENQPSKFSVEALGGYYQLPGMLLGMDKSIVEHPNHLVGNIQGLRGSYAVNDNNLVGATWLKIKATGNGDWARNDTAETLAENNVAGVITGRTDVDLNGFTLDYEHRFWLAKSKVRPYLRAGLGVGEITVDFQGKFIGHETMSGFDFPVEEDARDRVKRTIPIVAMELGLRFMFTEHLNAALSGYWNTGHGASASVGWKF